MKQGLTDITLIVDNSGSMTTLANDTIGGYNSFINTQKGVPGEALVTTILFNSSYTILHSGIPLNNVPELTIQKYLPGGMTALFDAVGTAIDKAGKRFELMNESDRPEKVIFVILTDGEENSSKEYTLDTVQKAIEHQKTKYNWDFVFLGANIDAKTVGTRMGINAGNTMTFVANSAGTTDAFASISQNMVTYRSGNLSMKDSYFSMSDVQKQKDAGL